jgi:hypothetical protein
MAWNFVGPSYTSLSPTLDAQRTVNLYIETDKSGQGKSPAALLGTPGLAVFCTLPDPGPIRGMLMTDFARLFVVSGTVYYEVHTDGSYTVRGAVTDDVNHSPVKMEYCGNQIFVVASGVGYVDYGDATPISNSLVPVSYANGSGTVTASGSIVTNVNGNTFDDSNVGNPIIVNGATYTVATASGSTCTTTAPVSTTITGKCDTNGTLCTYVSGSGTPGTTPAYFDYSWVGATINIAGTDYTISSYNNADGFVLASSAGTQTNVTFTYTPTVLTGRIYSGTCNVNGTDVQTVNQGAPGGSMYFYVNSTESDPGSWERGQINIDGTNYTVSKVNSGTDLSLVTGPSAPLTNVPFSYTSGVPYSATYPMSGTAAPGSLAFMDSYFIVGGTGALARQLNSSSPNDGTKWDPADYGIKEGAPDRVIALLADHELLWVFGGLTTEVWQDTGALGLPFTRNPNGFIQIGCAAGNSPVRIAGFVGWLAVDSRGGPFAVIANGFIPTRVSTEAVEAAWAAYGDVEDCVSYAYTEAGHDFWVLSFPSASATWVYDATEKVWHERCWFNPATNAQEMARGMFHAYVWGEHLLGDHETAVIYRASVTTLNDFGGVIERQRAAPHIANSTYRTYFSQFILDVGYSSTALGTFTLDWSDDGGKTFSNAVTGTVYTGENRVVWRRLGSSRDRVFRVTYSGGGQVAWINGHADSTPGTT